MRSYAIVKEKQNGRLKKFSDIWYFKSMGICIN